LREKLAIVGCATHTRDDVDYNDQTFDIWVFNESASKEWCKRADGVFQMHAEAIWKNPLNRGDAEHGKWLMSGNTPTIFMLEQYPEIPKAVKYPRKEVVKKLLKNLTVDSERGRKDYFTSTIAYLRRRAGRRNRIQTANARRDVLDRDRDRQRDKVRLSQPDVRCPPLSRRNVHWDG
jgi:hypothetical protein